MQIYLILDILIASMYRMKKDKLSQIGKYESANIELEVN